MSSDSVFIVTTDRVLEAIGAAVDDSGADADWTVNDGVLTIECDDGSKVIVNRHLANREVWVAGKSGGFHFRPVAGAWLDTRSGQTLSATVSRLLIEQGAVEGDLDLPVLPVP